MRHYTSIKESKKLLELGLNQETADMCYALLYTDASLSGQSKYKDFPDVLPAFAHGSSTIPCWSVGALMSILGKRALEFDDDGSASLSCSFMGKWTVYMFNCPIVCSDSYDNPIDACFDVMVKVLNNDNLKKEK